MMPVVRISDQTWIRLQSHAKPFEDTPDSVINLALDALDKIGVSRKSLGVPAKVSVDPVRSLRVGIASVGRPKKNGDRLPQKEFRNPLLLSLNELGGRAELAQVRSVVEKRLKPLLRSGDFSPVGNGDPRWWNAVCWARKHLVTEGYFRDDSPRGVWELSEKGRMLIKTLRDN